MYDLLIRGGRLVDPANRIDGFFDVAVSKHKIVEVGCVQKPALRVLDADGAYVFPGVIDLHVHISMQNNGAVAHKMLARAGVTTAIDLGGPVPETLEAAANHGAGLTIATLETVRPGGNVRSRNPGREEIRAMQEKSRKSGAIGIKIHYDQALEPEAVETAIDEANRQRMWVAFHCGTTETNSDIHGLAEAVRLAGKNRLHLAHVNSYCRGQTKDPVKEALDAAMLLKSAPHLLSESYLAAINGTSARCEDGLPVNKRVRMWLEMGGYAGTEAGMRDAIHAGWARVHAQIGDETVLSTGEAGVRYWESVETRVGLSFAMNPAIPRAYLATLKDDQGRFVVDAIGTDGGGIPRNDMVSSGLGLVQLEMLGLSDLVTKICHTPARALGLSAKGHLAVGADADIAIVDPVSRKVKTTVSSGEIIMHEGIVFGRGSKVLTTDEGARAVSESGCVASIIDVAKTGFYTGDGLKA